MPKLDGTGPDKKGKLTGRGLGLCRAVTDNETLEQLGRGLGLRRNAGGGIGQSKRLQSGLHSIQKSKKWR